MNRRRRYIGKRRRKAEKILGKQMLNTAFKAGCRLLGSDMRLQLVAFKRPHEKPTWWTGKNMWGNQ